MCYRVCPMPTTLSSTVREQSQLSVDVSELLRVPGSTKRLKFDHQVEGLRLPAARIAEGTPLHFDLRLEALVDGIHAAGTVAGAFEAECVRCLRVLHSRIVVELDDVYLPPSEAADADTFEIIDEHIDLEPGVRDALVLELPLNPLCSADCRGLCPQCGADRNVASCGHVAERTDDRWEPLRGLRGTMEE